MSLGSHSAVNPVFTFEATMTSALSQLLASRLLAEFDPQPDVIRYDPRQVAAISRIIRRLPESTEVRFATPKGRWDFLEAARRYLSPLGHEELLVAFGSQGGRDRRARSRLVSTWRSSGSERRVELSADLLATLETIAKTPNAEAILVHNHPPYWLRHLAANAGLWRPTASSADRDASFEFELKSLATWARSGSGGRLRWYLVDEDDIAEFRFPSVDRIVSLAASDDLSLFRTGGP